MGNDLTPAGSSEFLFYQTADGRTRLRVRMEGETVWLSQRDMVELFQTTKQNISLHIQNLFDERELTREATVKDYLTVQTEGTRRVERRIDHYNLDVIISVGYRVKSLRGTQFRMWATERLREYIVKGFTMDDERLKAAGGGGGFETRPYADQPGCRKRATLNAVRRHGHVLTTGRCGGAGAKEGDGKPFEDTMRRLKAARSELRGGAVAVDAAVETKLQGMGYGG